MAEDEFENEIPEGDSAADEEPVAEEPPTDEWADDEWLEEDAGWSDPDAMTEVFEEQPVESVAPVVSEAPGPMIDMPIEEQRTRALALAGIAFVLFLTGYLIGNTNGSNVDAAKAEGKKAGTAAGIKAGKKTGYDNGFKKGEETAYKAAYSKAYRAANPNGVPDAAKAYKDR